MPKSNSVRPTLNGTGIGRDNQLAYLWFAVAAGQTPLPDNREAIIEMRNIAAARMTPEEESSAARRAAEWRPTARVAR